MITVRAVTVPDADSWLDLRHALWPESSKTVHREEISRYFAGTLMLQPATVLVAEDRVNVVLGFVELSVRPGAEGCVSNRVAYLEGWFVAPRVRHQGIGTALISAAERWAREQECFEFASDADPANTVSVAAHRALGFEDVGLVRCFKKVL